MKSRTLAGITTMTLFAALAAPIQLAAQEQNKPQPRYKLVDLGTLGGPNSGLPTVFDELNGTAGAQAISNQGTVGGTADTSTADPLCYFDDCFYPNAFQWQNGVLTSLEALPGTQWSAANWISGNGLITGVSENGETDPLTGLLEGHAVLWRGGGIVDLGTLPGGYESFGYAVNNRGQVVGLATNGTPDPFSIYYGILGFSTGTQSRAFLWDRQNGMQDLGTLGGPDAWAALVNDRGQVAGISDTSFTPNANNGPSCAPNVPGQEPFFWEKDTGMIDMGTFGGTCGIANALNSRGQAAGQSYLAGNLTAHAFLWDKRAHPQMRDLGTLGGDNAGALWLNDAGEAIGYADLPPNPPGCAGLTCVHHGFLWKHGVMTDLGSIGTDPCSRALSINSRGQIVGATAAVCGGPLTHGFLWQNGGPAIDLNTLVAPGSSLSLTTPVFINDRGEIAGIGTLADGTTHAFVLIPCGESDTGCGDSVAAPAMQPSIIGDPAHSDGPGGTLNLRARRFAGRHTIGAALDNAAGSREPAAPSRTGVTSGPNVTLSAASLTFAVQLVRTTSAAQPVTLTNSGTASLSITSITSSGDFAQTNTCGSSLAAGASCTVSVSFRPTRRGSRLGTLSIADNAPGSPQTVSLKGTGTVVELRPASLAFSCIYDPPYHNTCPSPPETITLTNRGGAVLSISSITLQEGLTFHMTTDCGTSVAAGGSCTITVTFTLIAPGNYTNAVIVSDNGGGSPQKVPLSGKTSS